MSKERKKNINRNLVAVKSKPNKMLEKNSMKRNVILRGSLVKDEISEKDSGQKM